MKSSEKRQYYLLLIPVTVAVILLLFVPLVYVLYTSLTDFSLGVSSSFIGIQNYLELLFDDRMWNSLRVTAIFVFFAVLFQVGIGFMLALLLSKQYRIFKSFRAFFIIPMLVPPIVSAIIWKIMFIPHVPGVPYFLSLVGIPKTNWLQSPLLAMTIVVIAAVWQWTPFVMLISLAGLEGLPDEPFESAAIDGASNWQIFRHITVPMMRPTLVFLVVLRMIESLKVFPLIYVITQGGPGTSTEPLNYYAYITAFRNMEFGYSATLLVALLLIAIAIGFFGQSLTSKMSY